MKLSRGSVRAFHLVGALLLLSEALSPTLLTLAKAQTPATVAPAEPKAIHKPAKPKPAAKPAAKTQPAKPEPAAAAKPAANAPADAQTTTLETTKFNNWTVSCDNQGPTPATLRCIARLNVLKAKDDPRPILFMGVVKDASPQQRFIVQTPTSVQVKQGVEIAFGKNGPRRLDYVSCEPALCTAEIPLDATLAEELKNAATATVKWSTIQLGEAKVDFPLDGAGAAIAYLASR
jgi:invasion protein IalB